MQRMDSEKVVATMGAADRCLGSPLKKQKKEEGIEDVEDNVCPVIAPRLLPNGMIIRESQVRMPKTSLGGRQGHLNPSQVRPAITCALFGNICTVVIIDELEVFGLLVNDNDEQNQDQVNEYIPFVAWWFQYAPYHQMIS